MELSIFSKTNIFIVMIATRFYFNWVYLVKNYDFPLFHRIINNLRVLFKRIYRFRLLILYGENEWI
jgi:hypothetical protein